KAERGAARPGTCKTESWLNAPHCVAANIKNVFLQEILARLFDKIMIFSRDRIVCDITIPWDCRSSATARPGPVFHRPCSPVLRPIKLRPPPICSGCQAGKQAGKRA